MAGAKVIWAKSINTPENDSARGVSVFDQQVVGVFSSSATSPSVWGDAVVRAFDRSTGATLWEKTFGTTDSTYVSGVAHSPDGYIYVSGGTREVLGGNNYGGAADSWIARLDPEGTTVWIRNFSNHLEDDLSNLAVDSDGNAYVAGTLSRYGYKSGSGHYMSDYSYLGGDQAYAGSAFTGNWMSAIRKVSPSGEVLWTRVDGSYNSGGGSLAIDPEHRIIKASYTFAPVNGQAMVPGFDNGNGANVNIYLISYLLDGTVEWTKMKAEVTALAIDTESHSIYIGNQNRLEKLDASGNTLWSQSLEGRASDIGVGQDGNIHVIIKDSETSLLESTWDSNGNPLDTTSFAGTGDISLGDIVMTSDGTRYVSGTVKDGTIANSDLMAGGNKDAVIWSYGEPSTKESSVVVRGNSLYTIVDGPSWTQAEANSVKLGGHLTAIGSEEENQFVWTEFGPSDTAANQKWIGLNDAEEEGTWRWSNGEEVVYTNWAYIAPANTSGVSYEPGIGRDAQDYVNFWWGTNDGTWDDYFENGGWGPDNSKGIAEIPFIRRGDSAYVIVEGPTWEEAEANAVKLGGHLVTINDVEEEQFLLENTPGGWIGYTDRAVEGQWEWIDGSPKDYERWDVNNPSNNWGIEDYAYLDKGAYIAYGAGWNDIPNDYWNHIPQGDTPRMGGIVEIQLAPNNTPTGTPTLSGTTKVGQVITIDRTPIQDADNFGGWTPTYKYTWEVANDPGMTMVMPVWEALTTADATDGDENLEITDDLTGKLIRGVVSYVDGYGTNETVYSSEAKVEASVPTQRLISLPTDLTAKVGQIIEVPITINQAQDLQALDLNFAFDPELFSVPTSGGLVRAGSLTSSWTFTGNLNTSTNTLKVSGFSSESLSAVSGDLAYLRLQVKGTAPRGEAVLDLISLAARHICETRCNRTGLS